jgi:hypothetical protein
MRFEVLTAAKMSVLVSWVFHLQGRNITSATRKAKLCLHQQDESAYVVSISRKNILFIRQQKTNAEIGEKKEKGPCFYLILKIDVGCYAVGLFDTVVKNRLVTWHRCGIYLTTLAWLRLCSVE